MKFCAFVLLFAAVVYAADDTNMMVGSSYGGSAPAPAPSYGSAPAAAPSYGGGSSSIPAPPCPKNYLFSCQPNLQPAPCAPPAPSYGSAGAYSANYPAYVLPQWGVNGFRAY